MPLVSVVGEDAFAGAGGGGGGCVRHTLTVRPSDNNMATSVKCEKKEKGMGERRRVNVSSFVVVLPRIVMGFRFFVFLLHLFSFSFLCLPSQRLAGKLDTLREPSTLLCTTRCSRPTTPWKATARFPFASTEPALMNLRRVPTSTVRRGSVSSERQPQVLRRLRRLRGCARLAEADCASAKASRLPLPRRRGLRPEGCCGRY